MLCKRLLTLLSLHHKIVLVGLISIMTVKLLCRHLVFTGDVKVSNLVPLMNSQLVPEIHSSVLT